MALLTPEQMNFLAEHSVSINDAFDATGMTRTEFHEAMKEEGSIIGSLPQTAKERTATNPAPRP